MELLYQRDIYGQTLVKLGKQNERIVALDADLSGSTRTAKFGNVFPERFFNFGVAEQNMVGVAAGLASCGKVPFVSTFAIFATGRAWDQIRNTICYNNLNVKIVVTHAGITVGPDGSSHQALEDIALMRPIPNMTIVVPCDGPETEETIEAVVSHNGPVYVRLGRPKVPTITGKIGSFKLGKARLIQEGEGVTIVACGIMVKEALEASHNLKKKGITPRIVNMHTVKPLDKETIIRCARQTKRIVVCEEHMVNGGLGSAVSEVLAESYPVPIVRIGVRDKFGQSGSPEELMKEYRLTSEDITKAVLELVNNRYF
jgi:transketolase